MEVEKYSWGQLQENVRNTLTIRETTLLNTFMFDFLVYYSGIEWSENGWYYLAFVWKLLRL